MVRNAARRHIITLQNPASSTAQTTDDYGGISKTYETAYSHVHAAVTPVNGREFLFGKQVKSESTLFFDIRWITGIDTDSRIVYEGQTYNVVDTTDVEQKRKTLIIEAKVNV